MKFSAREYLAAGIIALSAIFIFDSSFAKLRAEERVQKSPDERETTPVPQNLSSSKHRLREGREYLTANKQAPGVIERSSGLQYKIIKSAPNGRRPAKTDIVSVHYQGALIDGTIFDSSYKRGKPIEFPVNRVIKGWQEALSLMRVGEKWRLFIPPHLAYGKRAVGTIRPNETLLFEVELLDIR